MITAKDLRDLGFALVESGYDYSTYSFPDRFDHNGMKLRLSESKSDIVQRDQFCNVIDANGIMQPQSIHNLDGLQLFLDSRFGEE